MEFRQIKYFIEVAKNEHVTQAANALHVAQSAVSRQIANLESELGVQLFIREGRNVKLTPVGRIFLKHMEIAVTEIENAKQKVDEFLDPEAGIIRVGFPNSLAANTLPTMISAFRDHHPNVGFQLRQGQVSYLVEAVEKGEIDLAFVAPVPKNETEVTGHIFFTEKMWALLPVKHDLAEREFLRLDELRNDPFVLYPNGLALRDIVVDGCKQMGFDPKIAFESEDIDTIKGLVGAGLGVSLLPEITLIDNVPREAVKVHISEPSITRTVGIVVPKNRELAPSEKLFFEFLKDFYDVLSQFGR